MDYEAFNHHSYLQFYFGRTSPGADGFAPDTGSDLNHSKDFGNPCQARLNYDHHPQEDFCNLHQAGYLYDDNGQDHYCHRAQSCYRQDGNCQDAAPASQLPSAASKTATAKTSAAATWITTGSGLKYQDVVVGKGPLPKPGDDVLVNYTGRFPNGKVFDTSLGPGRGPFELHLGRGEVIKGWDEGLSTMHVGGKRKLTIPPGLAYGAQGYPGAIPPNSTLIFDVELLKIK